MCYILFIKMINNIEKLVFTYLTYLVYNKEKTKEFKDMKKYIIPLILAILILGIAIYALNKLQEKSKVDIENIPNDISKIEYVRVKEETEGGYVYYKTDDKKIIEEVINALKNIKVEDKVNIAFSDNGRTYMIVLKNGETLIYNFQGSYYNKNKQNYETSNYESLRKIDIPKE